jgi:sugar lactone lactonase YvrE
MKILDRKILPVAALLLGTFALDSKAELPMPGSWNPVEGRKAAVAALGDCEAGKVEQCRAGLRRALELQPRHPEFLQFLASAEERLGHGAAALEALAAIHTQNWELTFDPPDEWVAKVVARPEYQKLYQETANLRTPLVRSSEAFRLPYRRMLAEGIAHDAKTGDFFVSGVHQRRIVRRNAKGEISDFVKPDSGALWSVLGMAADAGRRHLWVTTTAYPPMEGYAESLAGRSALVCFDLDSGKELARYESSRPGGKGFNDVRLAPDGAIFVTDHEERPGSLYRLAPAAGLAGRKLEIFGNPDALGSPEGLTFSSDGRYLFVADYSYGIVRYELATARHTYLQDPQGYSLVGLDHLDFHRGSLIAVQNGNLPHSVLRLSLSPDLGKILGVEPLERGHPSYADPTLGALIGDDLYYVAASNWGRLDEDEKLPTTGEPLAEPLILRLPLGQ